MNTLPVSASQSNDDFFKTVALFQEGSGTHNRPTSVRLHGKDGVWYESTYSKAEKRKIEKPWKDGSAWSGVILMVKWFAKEKHKEGKNPQIIKRTREFGGWDQPVHLLEIDFTQKDGTKELAVYPDYDAFKEAREQEFGKAVQAALIEKRQMPSKDDYIFDLWASVYVYDFESQKLLNIQAKKTSRAAIYEYTLSWKQDLTEDVQSISQVLTRFDRSFFTEPQEYYSIKLTAESILPKDYQTKIRDVFMQLLQWMKSFEKKDVKDVEEGEMEAVSPSEEVPTISYEIADLPDRPEKEPVNPADIPF
jgi:hypothetical protein